MPVPGIEYVDADEAMRERIAREYGRMQARYVRLSEGFTIVALCGGRPVGLLAVHWRQLPAPVPETVEAFIDIIDVLAEYRRRGIAREMIAQACERARADGAYQVRAWSSDDKTEAIGMWKALGFGMAPSAEYHEGREIRGYLATKVL
jgi:GNAT superfamily N-acetyltransferase